MNNPGMAQNNFLSSRTPKTSTELKLSSTSNGKSALSGKEQCLSLYFNLVKKKKQLEAKRPPKFFDKENDSRAANISRFNASKILFNDERKTPKASLKEGSLLLGDDKRKTNHGSQKIAIRSTGEWDRHSLFMSTDPSMPDAKLSFQEDLKGSKDDDGRLKMNFDQIFANIKQQRVTISASPQSSHLKSVSSPYCSPPDNHVQSTRSKSNLRDSRIDLLLDFENYEGPRIAIGSNRFVNEYCIDHPDKKTKFYITNNMFVKELGSMKLNRGFCSKCSVQVAMKGFTVEEILQEDEVDRKKRIDYFLKTLNSIKKQETFRLQTIQASSKETASHYAQQLQKTDSLFGHLIEQIKLKHRQVLDRLIQAREAAEVQTNTLVQLLRLKLDTVKAMSGDIESNLDKIITKIDSEPFNQIISNYEQNITALETQILQHSSQLREKVISKNSAECDKLFQTVLSQIIGVERCAQTLVQPGEDSEYFNGIDELGRVSEARSMSEASVTYTSRSMEESMSHKLSSRISNLREDALFYQAHPFNYQLYKKSAPNVESEIENVLSKRLARAELKKKPRPKDATALSFDHRVVVSKHKQAEDIEHEREHWKFLRENRQFMSLGSRNGPQLPAGMENQPREQKIKSFRSINEGIKEALTSTDNKIDSQSAFASALGIARIDSKRKTQSVLQESFEKELNKAKRQQPEFNDNSSLFSNNTEHDSTIKFISILDKINDNQQKKNRFYSEIIKDFDVGNRESDVNQSQNLEEFNILPFDDGLPQVPKQSRESFSGQLNPQPQHSHEFRPLLQEGVLKVNGPAHLVTHNVDHILEMHQPNQHEIIFECSKEWTVNQTPDMREKEVLPAHLALHFERLRAAGEFADSSSPSQKDEGQEGSRVFRLNCQKDLFGNRRHVTSGSQNQ